MMLKTLRNLVFSPLRHWRGVALIALAVFAVTPQCAHAQGSRKDDIAIGPRGTPLGGASVAICTQPAVTTTAPCSPLATLYSNVTLTQALANPITADGLGNYSFYALPGRYTVQIYGPSVTPKVFPDVILPSDPSTPTFASVTTTSGIAAFSLTLGGNLSVAGNSAVSGTLTVGGAPVPSTAQDLQWASNQRFKGPIPYRDITSFGPAGGCAQVYYVTNIGTGSISATSNQLVKSSGNWSIPNGCGVVVYGAGPTATLTAPTGFTGTAHTFTGSTNYYYQVIAIDNNLGYGPASSSVHIANGVATLGRDSYNYLYWTAVSGAVGYVIYESPNGTSWTAVGTSYTTAYCDMGFWQSANGGIQAPVPDFIPATPPAADGPQGLFAQTTAGNGTNTLTLNATATNTATTQLVYPDDSWELTAAAAAIGVTTDGYANALVIPPGFYRFAHMPTLPVTVFIEQRGTVVLNQLPIINPLPGSYNFNAWKGYGAFGGGNGNSGITSNIEVGPNVQAAFVLGSGAWLQGVSINSQGDGIYVQANAGADNLQDISINSGSGGTNVVGSPIRLDDGIIEFWADHLSLTASSLVGGPPAIWFNGETNGAGGQSDSEIYFSHISFMAYHSIKIDNPCKCDSNGLTLQNAGFDNIQTEENHDHGLVVIDGGSTGSEVNTLNLEFSALDQDSNYSNFNPGVLLIGPKGAFGPNYATGITGVAVALTSQSPGACFGGACTINTVGVDPGIETTGFCEASASNGGFNPGGQLTGPGVASICAGGSLIDENLGVMGSTNASTGNVQWGQLVAAPPTGNFILTPQTGTGSLVAGTYYYRISCINPDGGETLASGELNATLTATGEIEITSGSNMPYGCQAYRFYVGTSSGGENQYLKNGSNNYTAQCPCNSRNYLDNGAYTRTSASLANSDTAFTSKMLMDNNVFSYLLADSVAGGRLGVGTMADPGSGSGIKLDVAGGTVRGQSGFVAGTSDPAFSNSPRAVYHAFVPVLTSTSTDATSTLDKGVTVTRVQAQAITAPSGCSTNAVVRVTDGTSPINVTLSAAANDSGAITQNYAAGAALTISVSTAASGCTTSPANVNVEVQYRMQ